ncbi:hypothetical protein, partial [Bacteroides congonensis]|uniref:hypothetical protein n=1 Tax=Bacteroides congonensis TaxID=1871006 RepID=UPI002FDB065F
MKLIYHYPNDNSNSFFPEKKLLPISFFFRKIKSEKAKISSNNHWLFKKHSKVFWYAPENKWVDVNNPFV